MIWRREEYIAHSLFQYTGKEMFCELFGPLIGLERNGEAREHRRRRSGSAPLAGTMC